ncbi:MAG: hypothetical protein ACE5EL_05760, partial [Anaerolineae bacterium]
MPPILPSRAPMTPRRGVRLVALLVLAAALTSARAAADPAPPVVVAPAPADAADAAAARQRLTDMLTDLDQRTADALAASSDPAAVAEAARLRSTYLDAMAAVDRLSDDDVVRVEARLPMARAWPAIVAQLTQPGSAPVRTVRLGEVDQATREELEQFRQEWHQIFDRYETWAPLTAPRDAEYLSWVADGRAMLASLGYEDLAALQASMPSMPNWQEAYAPDIAAILAPGGGPLPTWVVALDAAAAARRLKGEDGPRPGRTGSASAGEGAPAAGQPGPAGAPALPEGSLTFPRRGAIDAGGQCGSHALNMSVDAVIARQIAEAVLRGVTTLIQFGVEIAPKDIKIEVFGASVDIPNPFTFLAQIGKLVVNRVADGLKADVDVAGACQSLVHWQLTRIHSQSFVQRSQDLAAQLLRHHNNVTQRLNAVDFSERELWKLQLQLAVEENLLAEAPLADGSNENRIALFQWLETICYNPEELLPTPMPTLSAPTMPTPVSPISPAAANNPLPTVAPFVGPLNPKEECGLNLVRRIVGETISHNQQAGNNIHNAQ